MDNPNDIASSHRGPSLTLYRFGDGTLLLKLH
jgi:hypothetical protein